MRQIVGRVGLHRRPSVPPTPPPRAHSGKNLCDTFAISLMSPPESSANVTDQWTINRGDGYDMVRRVKGVTKLLLIMALFVPIGVTALPREASAAVPAGFSVTSLPTGIGQYDLTDFEFTPPEGGWFSAAKSGKINWTSATGAFAR